MKANGDHFWKSRAPSSSGLGLWLLKPATRVRIPSGLPCTVLSGEECNSATAIE